MDHYPNQTTPKEVTEDILCFCREIDPRNKPSFVPVRQVHEVRFNYCLTDVPRYAQKYGGNAIFGWIIWEMLGLLIEAEFHACWKDNQNNLVDITPKPDNESKILFLPDSQRKYQNKYVKGIRKLLVENEQTQLIVKVAEKLDQLREKHFRNDKYDAHTVDAELQLWLKSLTIRKPKIGRNEPCPCGSGLKYKNVVRIRIKS